MFGLPGGLLSELNDNYEFSVTIESETGELLAKAREGVESEMFWTELRLPFAEMDPRFKERLFGDELWRCDHRLNFVARCPHGTAMTFSSPLIATEREAWSNDEAFMNVRALHRPECQICLVNSQSFRRFMAFLVILSLFLAMAFGWHIAAK